MIVKHLMICCVVVCVLGVAADSSAAGSADWHSTRFDSLEGTLPSFLLRVAVLKTYTPEYADSLETGNEWWCITQVLDYHTDRLKQEGIGLIGIPTLDSGSDSSAYLLPDDMLAKLARVAWTHSGRTWHFWRSLAHYGRGAHELGLWNDLDPEVRRVLEELQTAFSPLLEPRDPVTLEPLKREELPDPKGRSERP